MKRSEDLLESFFERGIREAEAGAAQPDIREQQRRRRGPFHLSLGPVVLLRIMNGPRVNVAHQ
jgi:hypothetical protein